MRARLCALLLLAPLALAQQGTDIAQQAIKDPSLSGPLADPGQITLISSEKGTDARAEIGISIPGASTAIEWLVSIGAQASIEKKESVDLANLSGLTNGTVADLRITRISYGKDFNPDNLITTCEEYNKTQTRFPPIDILSACTDASITTLINGAPAPHQEALRTSHADAIATGAIKTCDAYNKAGAGPRINDIRLACADESGARAALQPTAKTKDCQLRTAQECWYALLAENIEKERIGFCERLNNDPDVWNLIRVTGDNTNCGLDTLKARGNKLPSGTWYEQGLDDINLAPSYLGLTLTVNSQSFAYAPGTILDPKELKEESKQGLGASLTYGRLFLGSQTYAGITGSIARTYKGDKAVQVCEAVPDTNQTICKTLARKAPSEDDNESAMFEVRQSVGRFGFNPRISYEFNDKAVLAELLAYLFTSKAKGLNGGVRLAYLSDDVDDNEDFSFGVFIGTAFQLFDQ